ncbi:MAG: GNAT family N-acetyltransferase [Bacilli bacterium]
MMIQPALKEDSERISVLSQTRIIGSQMTSKDVMESLADNNLLILKITNEDLILGYSLLRLEGTEGEIDEIAICRDFEGQGLGKLLLLASEEKMSEKGINTVYLEVREKNLRAIHLYEKNGYQFYRKRQGYYPDDNALCYKKELTQNER